MSKKSGGTRRVPVPRVVRLMLLPFLLALVAPATAQAVWSAAVTLSAAGQDADGPHVAVDESGDAVFVWVRYDGTTDCLSTSRGCLRVQTRARSSTGILSAVQTVSGAGEVALSPQVAVDQSGDAVFVWDRRVSGTPDRIQARARSAAGVLGPVQTLSPAGETAQFPQVAVDQSGDAVFVWSANDRTTDCDGYPCIRIQARARSAAGVLSAVQTLSPPGQHAQFPQVAVDQSGDAVFVWQRYDGTSGCNGPPQGCNRIQARARSAAGVLSAVQTLSAAGTDACCGQVGVDQGGDAVFVWTRNDGTIGCGSFVLAGCFRIQARARSAAGTLSAVQMLSDPGQHAYRPQVAVDQSGDAVFVWDRPDGGTGCGDDIYPGCLRVQASARSAAGALSSVQTLSAAGKDACCGQVGVDQSANAVFVWERVDGTTSCRGSGCLRIQARTRSATGALGAVQTLSAPGQPADAPDVGVDLDGDAVADWQRRDANYFWRIQEAAGP